MPYYIIALGIVTGICLAFGILCLFIGLLRKDNKPLNLTFALFALAYAGTLMNGIFFHSTTSLAKFLFLTRWDAVFVVLAFTSLIWYVALYTGVRPRLFLGGLTVAFIIPGIANIVRPNLIHDQIFGLVYISLPWGEQLTEIDATGTSWADLFLLAQLLTLGFILFAFFRQYRRGERGAALFLGAGMLWFIATIAYEILAETGVTTYFPAGEFGFLGIAIALVLQMTNSVIKTEESLAEYRQGLEILVEERTEKLKQANEDLVREVAERERAEEFLTSILDALPASVAILDQAGTILAVNAYWRQFAGQNGLGWADCGLNRNYLAAIEPGSEGSNGEPIEAGRGIRAVAAGRQDHFSLEYPCHSPDTKRWFQMEVTRFEYEGDNRVVIAHLDVTQRRQAEVALRESEERFRKVFEDSSIGMAIVYPNYRFVAVNASLCRMLGYTETELTALTFPDITHPDDLDKDLTQARKLFNREISSYEIDKRYVAKTGETIWIHLDGSIILDDADRPLYALAVIQDITVRRQAEQALNRRVQELAILHQMAQAMTTETGLTSALQQMSEIITHLFDARYTHILVVESETGTGSMTGFERDQGVIGLTVLDIPLADLPLVEPVLSAQRTVIVPDILGETLPDPVRRFLQARQIHALMLVPLLIRGMATGLLTVATDDLEQSFNSGDVRLAETIASDIAIAIENMRLLDQARAAAAAEERNRLARELHDSVTQTMYSVSIVAEAMPRVLERDLAEAKRNAAYLRQTTLGALAELRTLLFELRPESLLRSRLKSLLRQLAEALTGRSRIPVVLSFEGEAGLAPEVKVNLYRIAQEALNNIARHSQATRAWIRLDKQPERVALVIGDNGQGFDPGGVPGDRLGLRIMRERAEAIGAGFELDSAPGQGTQISVTWTPAGDKEEEE